MKLYRDKQAWWIGYRRDDTHHHVCLLPTVVVRWLRNKPEPVKFQRRPPAPAEPNLTRKRRARVTEAHMSQPRAYWNDSPD